MASVNISQATAIIAAVAKVLYGFSDAAQVQRTNLKTLYTLLGATSHPTDEQVILVVQFLQGCWEGTSDNAPAQIQRVKNFLRASSLTGNPTRQQAQAVMLAFSQIFKCWSDTNLNQIQAVKNLKTAIAAI